MGQELDVERIMFELEENMILLDKNCPKCINRAKELAFKLGKIGEQKRKCRQNDNIVYVNEAWWFSGY